MLRVVICNSGSWHLRNFVPWLFQETLIRDLKSNSVLCVLHVLCNLFIQLYRLCWEFVIDLWEVFITLLRTFKRSSICVVCIRDLVTSEAAISHHWVAEVLWEDWHLRLHIVAGLWELRLNFLRNDIFNLIHELSWDWVRVLDTLVIVSVRLSDDFLSISELGGLMANLTGYWYIVIVVIRDGVIARSSLRDSLVHLCELPGLLTH